MVLRPSNYDGDILFLFQRKKSKWPKYTLKNASLVMKEMQTKTTLRFHLAPV
jgi:hypothetical protein